MVSYDFSRVFQFLPTLWQALPMTLSILFLLQSSVPFSVAYWLGLKWEKIRLLQVFPRAIFSLFAVLPPIVLLFLVFYGLPEFLKWWLNLDINNWSKTVFVLFTMVLLLRLSLQKYLRRPIRQFPKVRWRLESVLV